MYDPDIEEDVERDLPKERRVVGLHKTAIIYPIDPHGFWKVRIEKVKAVPKEVEGWYTSVAEAEKAILKYFNSLEARPVA